ncbi:beta-galactosidase GalB [Alteromonas confluentis]|uniref:Beta-galactosidase n=1 Tax=Alteromonas confluentis TaxID=1656094 RepID=A0A1E7Z7W3_9ALTE|nr:beta-galactosidase GalB [Alteromonas confluentis]OFC69633.1 beta-galactosidase [Alteromonas confluentis]
MTGFSIRILFVILSFAGIAQGNAAERERVSFNEGWRFFKYESADKADSLIYDVRPEIREFDDSINADAKPTEAETVSRHQEVLKPWILPTGNSFIANPSQKATRPPGNPGSEFAFVQSEFDDSNWQNVNLPHDWAISGPFFTSEDPEVGGGMGRLPSPGVAWYRKGFNLAASDAGKQIFLDIDGAMSYSMVWLNGHLVGGWPYGYTSYRLDLTPYVKRDGLNQLAIRLDNPPNSSRWYPGGGIYRNVWLVKTQSVHVAHWGTEVSTSEVTEKRARVNLKVQIDNGSEAEQKAKIISKIYELGDDGKPKQKSVGTFRPSSVQINAGQQANVVSELTLSNPKLWGPKPTQTPHRYVIVTQIEVNGQQTDRVETIFGVRSLQFDADNGVLVNGEKIRLQGVNQHHDLGALGAAFNVRAAERQLQLLQDMGVNAIRLAHNPPAPELLDLTDKMGLLVLNESFDSWFKKKTPLDFHLIFEDWHEQDLRALVRRDRNHPSVIMWYIGNEVGEQYSGDEGAAVASALREIVREEDPLRPVTASMNWAKADFPFTAEMDVISLNYQGEGIRQLPEFEGTDRIRTPPSYPDFHKTHPDKMILSSETASAFSSRGIYLFPVTQEESSPVRDGRGGDSKTHQVSAYELYAVDFGSSADKVFRYMDMYPYVAGQFVWNGWDYLGEPTPYYSSRSSYSGMIDLAGFPKDRFYLYQSQWRPELPMVHMLPHWTWPEREGLITPVHVFTSGDEVELFLNGESLERKPMKKFEYRIRFDDVKYQPGELKAIAYKKGKLWAEDVVVTAGKPQGLSLKADRIEIGNDGNDLAFITVDVTDAERRLVPGATNHVSLSISEGGEIVATDNGDSTDFTPFPSHKRNAFSGKLLVIVKPVKGYTGDMTITANSPGLKTGKAVISVISN